MNARRETRDEKETKEIGLPQDSRMTRLIAFEKRRRTSSKNKTKSLLLVVVFIFAVFVPSRPLSRFEIIPAVEASDSSDRHSFPLPFVPFVETDIVDNEHAFESLLLQLDDFVQHAVSYLVRISHSPQQDPKFPGRFTYQADTRVSLDPSLQRNYWSHKEQPEYNLLRHIGAIYALSQAYDRRTEHTKNQDDHSDTTAVILNTMESAIGYLWDNALLPVPDHKEEWLAAWERIDPEDPNSEPDVARLGGAGLALLVMGQMEGIKPESVLMEKELRKLGAFIESLQDKKTGEFTSKYKWGIGPYHNRVSLYYPGEAALAMITLAELELSIETEEQHKMVTSTDLELEHQQHYPKHHSTHTKQSNSQRWITVATNALLYLERFRRDLDLDEIEPDHWALLATAKLLPILEQQREDKTLDLRDQKQADLEYSLIYSHGVKVAHAIVAGHTTKGLEKHNGCFTYDGRTHATATQLEGLRK